MNRKLQKNRFFDSLWFAFLLPAVGYIAVMIIAGHVPFGSSSILYSDMYHQYYPFFVEFRNTLRSGGSLQYNWSVGMGIDYLSLISYYLASPLNLLSVLVPDSWTLACFSLLVPIKLGLAGVFFSLFLRKLFGGQGLYANLFSAFYALCAWALGYQWNIMWLDTFALLPLVVLGEVYLLRDKKFLLYTLTLFLAVLCNYYIGLFVCVFVALVFFCYEISCWKGWKRFFQDLGRIAVYSLLGLALTAFLEIPAYLGLQNTYSSVNKFPTTFDLNITSDDTLLGLLDAMRQVWGNIGGQEPTFKEGLPNIYCGVLTCMLAIQFCASKRIRLREKILSVFLLLFFAFSFIIRQLDYIWHGFHFTNMIPYRFSFLFSFVLLVMAYRAFLLLEQVRPWQLILSTVLFLGLCALSDERFTLLFLTYNVGFALVYMALLFLRQDKRERDSAARAASLRTWSIGLACAMAAELACALASFGVGFGGTGISNYPRGTTDAKALIQQMKERELEGGFYRAEFTSSQTLNDGALNSVNGVSLFSSAANVNMTNYMAALGFGAKPNYNRYLYEDTSPVANAFLNLKYLLDRDGTPPDGTYWNTVAQQGQVTLLENNAYLPLGFLANSETANLNVASLSAGTFAFQNELFAAATGLSDPVFTQIDTVSIDTNGISITRGATLGYCGYSDAADGDTVTYSFTVPASGYVCIDVSGSQKNSFTVYKNGETVLTEAIGLPQIFAVGTLVPGDKCQVVFELDGGTSGNLDLTAAVLDESIFRRGLDILGSAPLVLTEFTDTKITGAVNATRTGILYTSIPYDTNWTAYVDGQEVEITPICGAMVGIRLDAGEHTLQFHYENQGFRLGMKLSLAALFVLVALYLVHYRPWVPRKKR